MPFLPIERPSSCSLLDYLLCLSRSHRTAQPWVQMCLHLEHVTNDLLRLTLRDLAEAFTLPRLCLGQSYSEVFALSIWVSLSVIPLWKQMWTQTEGKTLHSIRLPGLECGAWPAPCCMSGLPAGLRHDRAQISLNLIETFKGIMTTSSCVDFSHLRER